MIFFCLPSYKSETYFWIAVAINSERDLECSAEYLSHNCKVSLSRRILIFSAIEPLFPAVWPFCVTEYPFVAAFDTLFFSKWRLCFILLLILTSNFTSHEWLYNLVGFAVHCGRNTVALTCLKIIPSYLFVFAPKVWCFVLLWTVFQTRAETAQILLQSGWSGSYSTRRSSLAQIAVHALTLAKKLPSPVWHFYCHPKSYHHPPNPYCKRLFQDRVTVSR